MGETEVVNEEWGKTHFLVTSWIFSYASLNLSKKKSPSNLPAGERRQGLSQEIGNEDHEKRLGTWATGDRDREALTDRVIAAEMRRSGLRFVETQGIGIARL
jgi:hypothetical protein